MRTLHQELERENDIGRWTAPQLLPRTRHKCTPPLRWRNGVVLRAIALHAAQPVGRTQELPRRVPTPSVQVEQAVVSIRGDMPQVLAERRVEHAHVECVFRRQLRFFLQIKARRDCEYADRHFLQERRRNEQYAKAVYDSNHVVLRGCGHYGHQQIEVSHLWVGHWIEKAEERIDHRCGFWDIQNGYVFVRITFR